MKEGKKADNYSQKNVKKKVFSRFISVWNDSERYRLKLLNTHTQYRSNTKNI